MTTTNTVPGPFARACGHAGQHLGRAIGRTLKAAHNANTRHQQTTASTGTTRPSRDRNFTIEH